MQSKEKIVNSLLYYGLSLNMSDFGGNFYITFLLSGIVELPSQLLSPLMLRYMGRRKLYALFTFITGVSCFAIIPVQREWIKVTLALIGKFSVSTSFNVYSIHGPELLPTVLRQRGMGFASFVGRVGSISGPFMKNLAADYGLTLVMILYGCLMCVGSVLGLLLPETKDREIPDTIEEAERPCYSLKYTMVSSKMPEVKHIADIVGEWGKWQLLLFSFYFLLLGTDAINNMAYAFHAYNNDFWCSDVPPDYTNKTKDMKCFKFTNRSEKCNEWTYDWSVFGKTINTECAIDNIWHRFRKRHICWDMYSLDLYSHTIQTNTAEE
ncbi:unnamed protein product, partial [Medioppia subpectinata]